MKFFITFGQKYKREGHPTFPAAHPDGWVEVTANSQGEAREKAFSLLGTNWAFIYAETVFEPELFPMGKLGEIA